jgi:6-phosphogluconate dehydrogenase
MQIGMIGLGRMGANMAHRLVQGGHECVAYDPRPEAVRAVGAYGARGVGSLAALAGALERPRALWIMVPAGTVDAVLGVPLCPRDGHRRRHHYHDDIRRSGS